MPSRLAGVEQLPNSLEHLVRAGDGERDFHCIPMKIVVPFGLRQDKDWSENFHAAAQRKNRSNGHMGQITYQFAGIETSDEVILRPASNGPKQNGKVSVFRCLWPE